MTKIAIVGAGWRSEFYLRIAQMLPDKFEIVGIVVRNSEPYLDLENRYRVPIYLSTSELLLHQKPEFAVSAVSWDSNPEILHDLVAAGVYVLSETPPASDLESLRRLWQDVGSSEMVQVAEQYLYLPGHAARLSVIKRGEIGTPTSVEVSSTHGYHAVSMMRGFLNSGFGPTSVSALRFNAPLVDPLARDGWNMNLEAKEAGTTISLINFGQGKSGIYNFVDNQWHNQLRHRRIVVRGSNGELVDDKVIRLVDGPAITSSEFVRYQLGQDLNLDGHDTEHISFDGKVVYKNSFIGLRLMDEEIAIAQMMVTMSDWIHGKSQAPYPLREAAQDQMVSLTIDESLKTGRTVRTVVEAWAIDN